MKRLSGTRALITGAGSGIGRSLALRLAREGCDIVACDLDERAADATRADIVGAGGAAWSCRLDVTDAARVAEVRDTILAERGPVDLLINNAGVVYGGAFLDVPLARHAATYQVNTLAPVSVTYAWLPHLLGRPEAHLVYVASASGFVGLPFGSTYASSKWAAIGFAESLRAELAVLGHRHVGVTAVCPSFVRTGMFDGVKPPSLTPMLTPERVADLTVAAIRRRRAFVLAPWLVKLTPALNALLPRPAFDAIARLFGVSTSMASWRGRR
jgi:all-trans-retinol dehydrogenase (NAD+)